MPADLSTPIHRLPLICLDTETTGASAALGERVIELGMVRMENGQVAGQLSQLIDPGRPLPPNITYITGITQQMLIGQPRFADVLEQVLGLLAGGAVLLGHNAPFDLSFLSREFRLAQQDLQQVLGQMIIADTLRLARRRFGRGGNSLPMLAARLGVPTPVSHRALADAQTTVGVLERLLEPLGGWDTPLGALLEAQGGSLTIRPAGEDPLPLELQEAIDQDRPVVMEYVDAYSKLSHRTVQPRYVRRLNGQLLLVAWCHLRQAERTFRVDRIVRLRRSAEIAVADAGEGAGEGEGVGGGGGGDLGPGPSGGTV